MKKESKIEIKISLDDQKVPDKIHWRSDDNPEGDDYKECKAFMLSLFDKEYKDTFKIDLWTKEMQVVEMDRFVFHTLRSLVDTYKRATNNLELVGQMQQFVQYFGEKTEILDSSEN